MASKASTYRARARARGGLLLPTVRLARDSARGARVVADGEARTRPARAVSRGGPSFSLGLLLLLVLVLGRRVALGRGRGRLRRGLLARLVAPAAAAEEEERERERERGRGGRHRVLLGLPADRAGLLH